MDKFLKTTTAHGLSHLNDHKGWQNVFWYCICLGVYLFLIVALMLLGIAFMDPTNLKSGITVEMVTQTEAADGQRIFPSVYPRFVLCAHNSNVNLTKYEEIKIHYVQQQNLVQTGHLPPMRLTMLHSVRRNWIFMGYGM